MALQLTEVDSVEILTLQDNYVDLVAGDGNEVVRRAMPIKGVELKNSIMAEHGFSAVVTVTRDGARRSILFDFGFSEIGAAYNAEALGVDLSHVETLVLSHGHPDHTGGLANLMKRLGRPDMELVLHPAAFKTPRYLKIGPEFKVYLPPLDREKAGAAGVRFTLTAKPRPLLGGGLLFMGEIPRRTPFEKGLPNMFTEKDGQETWDPIEDDTGIVAHVRGKGLVVLSGCSHAGIVNTVLRARELTGVDQIFAVMGGFHLTGPVMKETVAPTVAGLKEIDPTYVVPTHCTGREAIQIIEREMPGRFLLNMSGTTMVFAA